MDVHSAADLPTRFHLWCAEQELRRGKPPSPGLAAARRRNLDRLRAYRRSRAFPRNTGRRPTPVFVDTGGRHCAVAHLMREAGDDELVRQIAETSNLALLGAMDGAAVGTWAAGSGLTTDELARIQPQYATVDAATAWLYWFGLMLTPFALTAIVMNLLRLGRRMLREILAWTTIGIGSVMIGLYVAALLRYLNRPPAEPCDMLCTSYTYLPDLALHWVIPVAGALGLAAGAWTVVRTRRERWAW
jgi:hypothetical protein